MSNELTTRPATSPVAAPKSPAPAPAAKAPAPKGPAMTADRVDLSDKKAEDKKAAPDAPAAVPGESVRNQVSLFGTVAGPVVTAKQGVNMLAKMNFKQNFLQKGADFVVKNATKLGGLKFFSSVAFQTGFKWVGRCLPVIGAGILAFDGYSAFKTFTDPEASTKRKVLTGGRFAFNALGTVLNFIPGVGMIYGIPAGLVGNAFEYLTMRMNAKGEK